MKLWKRNRAAESDAELDARMFRSRTSFIEHYNATFDFEAGLEDAYNRAGVARPEGLRQRAAAPTVNADDSDNRLLRQVCDHIDMIDNLIASIAGGDSGPFVATTYLTTSRLLLHRLRTGLRARSLTQMDAFYLISSIRQNLREVDLIVRHHQALPLGEELRQRINELTETNSDISEQIKRLEASVSRLFDTEHEATELVPAH